MTTDDHARLAVERAPHSYDCRQSFGRTAVLKSGVPVLNISMNMSEPEARKLGERVAELLNEYGDHVVVEVEGV